MDYTINALAKLSGVTVRTLRFYDEIGLLRPAYIADNGYRYYQKKQLLLLQQILFFRELGFELKDIQKVLKQNDFDRCQALKIHKKILRSKIERIAELIKTINNTIKYLEEKKTMQEKDIFHGFNPEIQASYELYLIECFGAKVKERIAQSHQNIKEWKRSDWEMASQEFALICVDLTDLLEKKYPVESKDVQSVIKRHYDWIKKFWMPNKESYEDLAQMYTAKEWEKTFITYHPQLAEYLSDAMKLFARKLL